MEKETRIYKRIQDNVNRYLASVSKMSAEEIENMVKNEKEFWMTGEEAIKYGFADKLLGE
jgi:ATP-dependent protease ClpP protease subunit